MSRDIAARLCMLLAIQALASGVAAQSGFTDISAESGLDDVRAERAADWWVSGLHFVDLDGDGALDVFLSSHGSYGALAALGDGRGHFTAVADGYPSSEIHIPYDFDEDGRLDLSMTYQDGGGQIWLNESTEGSLSFIDTDITRETNTSRIQVMLDVDRDGNVDWVRASETEDGVIVDLGDGKGHFEQGASALPGLGNVNPIPVDLDGDGDEDWVTSWGDYRYEPGMANVYREDGELDLVDVTADIGLYVDMLAIQGVGDFDQDGDADLIAIENESFPPSIFLNDGDGRFSELADAISGVSGAPNYPTWGLGVVTDLDNDGVADVLFGGRNYLQVLHGTGGGHFEYQNDAWGIADTAEAAVDNGFAFGDIDGDGDLDLLGWREIYPDRYFTLYRNDVAQGHWLRVRVVGRAGNRGAAGAKIRVYRAGTDELLWYEEVGIYCRQVQPGYGYHFAQTERHFGLGDVDRVDVTVEFYPSHALARADDLAVDQLVQVGEDGAIGPVAPPGGEADGGVDAGAGGGGSGGAGTGGATVVPGPGGGSGSGGSAAGSAGSAAGAGAGIDAGSSTSDSAGSGEGCSCGVAQAAEHRARALGLLAASLVALRARARARRRMASGS